MTDHDPYCLMDTAHRLCICISLRMARDDQGERIAQEQERRITQVMNNDSIEWHTAAHMLATELPRIARGGESDVLADEYDRAQNGWGMDLEVDR